MKPHSESCERNREPILAVLRDHFRDVRQILEIGSGTGQHAVYFGAALPRLTWQTSDLPEQHAGIRQWLAEAALPNVLPPLALDVAARPWPVPRVDAVFSANTLHIMAWERVQDFFAGLPQVLGPAGLLVVYGLMRQESRFTIDARSDVGALGLMQIMPATARWIARRLGINDFRANSAHDLDVNLRFGTYYLRYALDGLADQPVLATAGYNAGPLRARRWQADRPLDATIYIDTIPFQETRDYVKKVMNNAMFYARRFDTRDSPLLKARLGVIPPRP